MLSNILVQKIIYLEIKKLLVLYKNEIKKYLSYNFFDYLKNVLFPKGRTKYYKLIRILFFFFLIRFIIDIVKFFFNFYYITLNWFFSNLKFCIKFYTDNELIILFFSKIINFIRYFFLFIPLVNISEDMNKRKLTMLPYLIVKTGHKIIRLIWWRPRIRKKLIYPVKVIKMFVIWFGLMPTVAIKDFLKLWIRIFQFIYLLFIDWILFMKIIYYTIKYNRIAGVSYLRKGSSLFHIAVLMQKHGFKAPKANKYDKLKANIDYRQYCRRYKKSDLPPDYLNSEALDIYVFLLELFSDTRYELKYVPIKEFFFLIYPYEFLFKLYYFFYYLYIGTVFLLLYTVFIPLVLIYLGSGLIFDYIESLRVIYFFFFNDLDDLAKEKDRIWANIRKNSQKKEKKKNQSLFLNNLKNKIKKIYEKIIR